MGASIQLSDNDNSSLLTPTDSKSTPLNYSHITILDSGLSYDESLKNRERDSIIVIDDSNIQCDLENDCSFDFLDNNDISIHSNTPRSFDAPKKASMECSLLIVPLSREVVQSFTQRAKQHAIISELTQCISETSDDLDCESENQKGISDAVIAVRN